MSTEQLCVNWHSHKNYISKGFSCLQQSGEFVDMTLAAEGHLVKVHQNIVALASPYLKAMIQSTSCQHPVVFLNNMSHEILGYILEYIYTGEVKILTNAIPAFIEACKALHINGAENLVLPKKITSQTQCEKVEPTIQRNLETPDNNFAAHITINSDNYNVEVIPVENNAAQDRTLPVLSVDDVKINYQPEVHAVAINGNNINQDNLPIITLNDIEINYQPQVNTLDSKNHIEQNNTFPIISINDLETSYDSLNGAIVDKEKIESNILTSVHNTTDQNMQNTILNLSMKEIQPIKHKNVKIGQPSIADRDKAQHYSISNRGSLQLLLNRYMYYCHHHSCGGRKRRWRCVDYRKLHCPAFIDTDDGNITNRSEVHSHPNHDAKILRKFKSKTVFTSLSQAAEKCTFKVKVSKASRYRKTINIL